MIICCTLMPLMKQASECKIICNHFFLEYSNDRKHDFNARWYIIHLTPPTPPQTNLNMQQLLFFANITNARINARQKNAIGDSQRKSVSADNQ